MALPILVGIWAAVGVVISIINEFRKVMAFVIAGVIWAAFIVVFGLLCAKWNALSSDMTWAVDGSASTHLVNSVLVLCDKINYVLPIWDVLRGLGIVLSVHLGSVVVHMILRAWETVPFKSTSA